MERVKSGWTPEKYFQDKGQRLLGLPTVVQWFNDLPCFCGSAGLIPSLDLIPGLGTSIYHGLSKKKKKKKDTESYKIIIMSMKER